MRRLGRAMVAMAMVLATERVARAAEPHEERAASDGPALLGPRPTAPAPSFDLRLAGTAAYKAVDGIPNYSGGLTLSITGAKPISPGLVLRASYGRTQNGLALYDIAANLTVEMRADVLRFHVGGGVGVFAVRRVTTGDFTPAYGPSGILGVGIEPDKTSSFSVMLDAEAMMYPVAIEWGPTLSVGYHF